MATFPVPSQVAKVWICSFLSPSTSGRSLAAEMITAKQVTKPKEREGGREQRQSAMRRNNGGRMSE